MSVLTDMIVAVPEDVQKIVDAMPYLPPQLCVEEMPNLSMPMLAGLYCVLANKRFSKKIQKEFPVLYEDSFAIIKVSETLVNALASIEKESISDIAQRWKEKQHLWCSRGLIGPWDSLDQLEDVRIERCLRDLQKLCKLVICKRKCLLLREC